MREDDALRQRLDKVDEPFVTGGGFDRHFEGAEAAEAVWLWKKGDMLAVWVLEKRWRRTGFRDASSTATVIVCLCPGIGCRGRR
jgi:hypothetical protein